MLLTHQFDCVLRSNIIFDIEEHSIDDFLKDEADKIRAGADHAWPTDGSSENLREFLTGNGYRYITISSSYGLWGFVLAKHFYIR